MSRAWQDIQTVAERAALGVGVPFAQAARFGAGTTRHLADGRDIASIMAVLEDADAILSIASAAEDVIEAASVHNEPWQGQSDWPDLLQSMIESLPCASGVTVSGDKVHAKLALHEPSRRKRPDSIFVPFALMSRLEELAASAQAPSNSTANSSRVGADLMQTD